MSATVLDFQQAVRRRNGLPERRKAGAGVDDAITQAVMHTFAHYPISIVAAAIQSARRSLANGCGFIEAMDAAARTVTVSAPEQMTLRSARYAEAMATISERMIRDYLKGEDETDIAQAIQRAERVLEGGGSLCTAIYHATKVDIKA